MTARLRAAKLRQQASVEDVDYRAARGLDRALFQKLAEGEWIDARDNLALVGPPSAVRTGPRTLAALERSQNYLQAILPFLARAGNIDDR